MRDLHVMVALRPLRTFTAVPLVLLIAVAFVVAPRHLAARQQPEDPRTILDRVFSVAQSDRGESRFKQSCSSCHRPDEFAGSAFSERWEDKSLGDIFGFISTAMPEDDPGSLKPDDYAAVIAFFLGQNGYPVGNDDLPGDPEVLARIGVVPNPK